MYTSTGVSYSYHVRFVGSLWSMKYTHSSAFHSMASHGVQVFCNPRPVHVTALGVLCCAAL